MSGVKWIKIVTNIFDDEKILLIESMPEADSITVVWFKLLCLAGKNNNSGVFMLNDKIHYTDEMLSTIFRKPLNVVRLALKTFENFGMIEIINDVITIPNWDKHQSLDAYERKKERDRIYQREKREKQKLLANKKSSDASADESSDVVALDKEEDKEIDKYIYSRIIDWLNIKTNSNFRSTTTKTKKLIDARLNEGFIEEDFKTVIDKKTKDWINNKDMCKYLRPETLFGTKFEGYLNEKFEEKKIQRNSTYKGFEFED